MRILQKDPLRKKMRKTKAFHLFLKRSKRSGFFTGFIPKIQRYRIDIDRKNGTFDLSRDK